LAAGYGLDDRGSTHRLGKNFSLLIVDQAGSVAHPASYPMSTAATFPGVKAAASEVSKPRLMDLYLQTLVVFTALCLMTQAQGQLYLYLLFQVLVENVKLSHEVLTAEVMKSCAFWKDL
jgi:hypothetical protein